MIILVISGCNVWCWLLGCMCLGFFLGSMAMYLCMSHNISVSKSCDGGCSGVVRWVSLFWEKRAHSHFSLSVVMVARNRPFWSYTWDSEACICMVGLLVRMSLSGLHSCVDVLRLVILSGGCMYFLSFVCVWLRELAYVWMVFCSWVVL